VNLAIKRVNHAKALQNNSVYHVMITLFHKEIITLQKIDVPVIQIISMMKIHFPALFATTRVLHAQDRLRISVYRVRLVLFQIVFC